MWFKCPPSFDTTIFKTPFANFSIVVVFASAEKPMLMRLLWRQVLSINLIKKTACVNHYINEGGYLKMHVSDK